MRRKGTDDRGAGDRDDRLQAIVDEAVREMAAPPPVNLKPGVMAAWDARQDAAVSSPAASGRGGARAAWGHLRPVAALAGLLLVVAASLVLWQQVERQGEQSTGATPRATPMATAPAGAAPAPGGSVEEAAGPALAEGPSRPATSAAPRIARRPPRPLVEVEFPVEQEVASLDYLPGAPAGNLGRGASPLPGPPPLAVTPVEPAPTVSEMSRPVSEFPAGDGNEPPGADHGDPGQSGGPRR